MMQELMNIGALVAIVWIAGAVIYNGFKFLVWVKNKISDWMAEDDEFVGGLYNPDIGSRYIKGEDNRPFRSERMAPIKEEILDKAKEIILGDRAKQYGSVKSNFATIARYWSQYLGFEVTRKDIGFMMILLKIARCDSGKITEDSLIDIAGYAACIAEVLEEDE